MWGMILAWLLKPRNLVIVAVAIALLGLVVSMLHYKNKAKKLEAELIDIKKASQLSKILVEETKKNIEKRIEVIREEYQKREEGIRDKYENQRKRLEIQLANMKVRIIDLDSQLDKVNKELERIQSELQTAKGEHKEKLEKKGEELKIVKIQLEKEREGLACLKRNVPNDEVRLLNEVLKK